MDEEIDLQSPVHHYVNSCLPFALALAMRLVPVVHPVYMVYVLREADRALCHLALEDVEAEVFHSDCCLASERRMGVWYQLPKAAVTRALRVSI